MAVVHFRGEGRPYCSTGAYYSDMTDDWNKVTCGACLRSLRSVEYRQKLFDKFCVSNRDAVAHRRRRDWKR